MSDEVRDVTTASQEYLHLASLNVQNFRCFKHLQVAKLGRVNLIVGKNSVGKTSLLEALRIYAQRDTSALLAILSQRDEFALSMLRSDESTDMFVDDALEAHIQAFLSLFFVPGQENMDREREYEFQVSSQKGHIVVRLALGNDEGEQERGWVLSLNGETVEMRRFLTRSDRLSTASEERIHSFLLPVDGLSDAEIDRQYQRAVASNLTDQLLQALHLLNNKIVSVAVVRDSWERERQYSSTRVRIDLRWRKPIIPIVTLRGGKAEPVPLRSLGDGMGRMFGLALAAVTARGGLLLVDEIDTGLHYTVQPEMWRFVFAIARKFNLQVFATTHSWDCVRSFQQVACADEESEGMLISLRRREDDPEGIAAVLYDEEDLASVAELDLEVR